MIARRFRHPFAARASRAAACALFAWTVAAPGQGHAAGPLRIEEPWSRETPPGTPVGVGYLRIVNEGETADRLLGARSPRAGRVTLHRSVEADGSARMERQHEGIVIPAGATVALQPGGYHLMLMQLERPLRKNERVPVTLRFEHAGAVPTELEVRALTSGLE